MFIDAIMAYFQTHPPVCKQGGDEFALLVSGHIKNCPECRERLIEFLHSLPKEFPILKVFIKRGDIDKAVDHLRNIKFNEEQNGETHGQSGK